MKLLIGWFNMCQPASLDLLNYYYSICIYQCSLLLPQRETQYPGNGWNCMGNRRI